MNRFKEFRRDKKSRENSKQSSTSKPIPQKHPGITSALPIVKHQPGEDGFSFDQHNKRLKTEYRKQQPNIVVVDDLMERSFSMRRQDITGNGYSGVLTLFDVYPFLQEFTQVYYY